MVKNSVCFSVLSRAKIRYIPLERLHTGQQNQWFVRVTMKILQRNSPASSGPGCDIGFAQEMLQTAQLLSVLQRALQDEVKTLRTELSDLREANVKFLNLHRAFLHTCEPRRAIAMMPPRKKQWCKRWSVDQVKSPGVSKDKCVSLNARLGNRPPQDIQLMREAYRHSTPQTVWRMNEWDPDIQWNIILSKKMRDAF